VSVLTIALAILILVPLVVWAERLQAGGAIADPRSLERAILAPRNARRGTRRFYQLALLATPIVTSLVTASAARMSRPHETFGFILVPALFSVAITLGLRDQSEVSRRRAIACAILSGVITALLAVLVVSG
jgi:hypothetical protein